MPRRTGRLRSRTWDRVTTSCRPPGDVASKGLDARTTTAEQFATSFVTVTANDPPLPAAEAGAGCDVGGARQVRRECLPVRLRSSTLAPLPIDRDLAPPLGDGWNSVSLEPDGTFEFQGVFGPTLFRELTQESDWYLKSVVIKGQELVDCRLTSAPAARSATSRW